MDEKRGTGRTTKQIKEAPKNAVYVWVSGDAHYPRRLARELGREDLEIVGPTWIENYRWRGVGSLNVVIDHAAYSFLTNRQNIVLIEMLHYLSAYKKPE